tara:strand:+ start:77 stop:820 length:744 start_codon:yes stop_codon:yes gene_type:complete
MARRLKQYIDFAAISSGPVSAADTLADGTTPGGAATGATGDENVLMFSNGETLLHHVLGTQTLLTPSMTAVGLDIGQDQTANDGCELSTSAVTADGGIQFVVGTDDAFYFAAKIKVADIDGTDDLAVGFRKVEAFQANIDDYDEMASLNVNGSGTTTKNIQIETILNGASTSTTDTTNTWADGATVTLKVLVSAAGVVTYTIDGSAPTTTATFTFDDAEVVCPFIYFLNDSNLAGLVEIITWDVGFQ